MDKNNQFGKKIKYIHGGWNYEKGLKNEIKIE